MEAVVWLTQEVIGEEMSLGRVRQGVMDLLVLALILGVVFSISLRCPLF